MVGLTRVRFTRRPVTRITNGTLHNSVAAVQGIVEKILPELVVESKCPDERIVVITTSDFGEFDSKCPDLMVEIEVENLRESGVDLEQKVREVAECIRRFSEMPIGARILVSIEPSRRVSYFSSAASASSLNGLNGKAHTGAKALAGTTAAVKAG